MQAKQPLLQWELLPPVLLQQFRNLPLDAATRLFQNERKIMNNKFDELTKGLAQSVTRRAALKKFGVGLAGMALACFGLANKALADKGGCRRAGAKCGTNTHCCSGICYHSNYYGLGICR
jgi:hypothetical protein